MKCRHMYCKEHIEEDYEETLKRGYGFCKNGHRTDVPGSTKHDYGCQCGARIANSPGHTQYCPEFYKTFWK